MADTQKTALSLFSGVGGLDLGWELVTGGRVVGYCERDAYAASVLLGRMEDQAMECAPVWCGDVAELDLAPFHGVGWVIGGFPCQDISVAGAGAGIDGERSGLWSELLRAYRDSGARYLFAENVSALTVRGLDRVLHDLAEVGADAEWLCLRASDVGASHRRERIFILADRERDAVRHEPGRRGWQDRPGPTGPRDVGEGVAHAAGLEVWPALDGNGDTQCAAFVGTCGFAPGPGAAWDRIPDHLHPATEPGLHVLADGAAVVVDESRADQLRCVGNGVVPLQAAAALVELLRRIQE